MDGRPKRQTTRNEHVELGKKYHIHPRTAKRYAESPQKPEYTLSEPKPTKMDPYKQIVDEWLEEAPYFGAADSRKAAGDGIQRGLQHRESVCEQPEDGLE